MARLIGLLLVVYNIYFLSHSSLTSTAPIKRKEKMSQKRDSRRNWKKCLYTYISGFSALKLQR